MAHFRGRITASGTVLLQDVQGDLFEHAPPGRLRSWNGQFSLLQGEYIGPGAYRLELDDGRSGDILITNANFSSHSNPSITFKGSGPLQ
jgi:hypothetical protein